MNLRILLEEKLKYPKELRHRKIRHGVADNRCHDITVQSTDNMTSVGTAFYSLLKTIGNNFQEL